MKTKLFQFLGGILAGAFIVLAIFLPLYLTKRDKVIYLQQPPIEQSSEEEYIFFGKYPQSPAKNTVTFQAEPQSDGYYLGSDGEEYEKVETTTRKNNELVTVYKYYKLEPIKWRVLKKEGDKALVVCDNVIDAAAYQPYYTKRAPDNFLIDIEAADMDENYKNYLLNELNFKSEDKIKINNYEFSYIRYFLNNIFQEKAFSDSKKAKIVKTNVDNSEQSTFLQNNQFACNNTEDNVFLLSAADVMNVDLGFKHHYELDKKRGFQVTSYAEQMGVKRIQLSDVDYELKNLNFQSAALSYAFIGTGYVYLRSPSSMGKNYVCELYRGSVLTACNAYPVQGVVPAMTINLSEI